MSLEELYLPSGLRLDQRSLVAGVPAYLILPREQDAPRPALLLLHGYSHGKAELYNHAVRAAQLGFVACAIDAWGHGERAHPPFPQELSARVNLILRVFQHSGPEVVAVLQALATLPEVRAGALGLAGISMGGALVHYALTLTSQVGAAVALISSAEWEWHQRHTDDEALRRFAVEQAPLAHAERYPPAALLLINGAQDETIPLATARRSYERLLPAYQATPERLRLSVHEQAGHRVTPEMTREAMTWLSEFLINHRDTETQSL